MESFSQTYSDEYAEIRGYETLYESGRHCFTIGVKHVEHAANHHMGMLGEETLRAIPCAACHKAYDDLIHKGSKSALVYLKQNVPEQQLVRLLLSAKPEMLEKGIEGYAFMNIGKPYEGFHVLDEKGQVKL